MAACFLQVRWRESGECGKFRGCKELVNVTATLPINNLDVTSVEKFFKTQLLPNDVTNTPRSYFAFKDRKCRILFT